jgi:hypothetical protein
MTNDGNILFFEVQVKTKTIFVGTFLTKMFFVLFFCFHVGTFTKADYRTVRKNSSDQILLS